MFHDFDELIEAKIPIKVLGKVMHIKPISLETLLSLVQLMQKVEKGEFEGDVVTNYHSIFSMVIDEVTVEDVKQMRPAQIAGIYALIMRRVNGESANSLAGIEEEVKKKT